MLYSKTAKYAVLALSEIANRHSQNAISTKEIARAAAVPYPLLAKIVGQLRQAGLVHAARGKHGGIRLVRPADEINIRDIVVALDGPDVLNDCPLFLRPCNCDRECTLHPLWRPARDAVVEFLENTTLEDVARARHSVEEVAAG
jgi:Rrf2 family transcriptional regulator, iron-sulfur cluster assembly transcription factor